MTSQEEITKIISALIEAEKDNLSLPFEQAVVKLCRIAYSQRQWEVIEKGPKWMLESAAETEVFYLLEVVRLRKLLEEHNAHRPI